MPDVVGLPSLKEDSSSKEILQYAIEKGYTEHVPDYHVSKIDHQKKCLITKSNFRQLLRDEAKILGDLNQTIDGDSVYVSDVMYGNRVFTYKSKDPVVGTTYYRLSDDELFDAVCKLSLEIRSEYDPELIITPLRGGAHPAKRFSDCMNAITMDTFGIRGYDKMKKPLKEPIITHPLSIDIKGKRILLTDDIADRGNTFRVAEKYIESKNPAETVSAVIFKRYTSNLTPDFFFPLENDDWIIFPGEEVQTINESLTPDTNDTSEILNKLTISQNYRFLKEHFTDDDIKLAFKLWEQKPPEYLR